MFMYICSLFVNILWFSPQAICTVRMWDASNLKTTGDSYVQSNVSIATMHSRDQTIAFTDRWSLYRGALISLRWPMEQPTVVSVDRWSLYRGALVSLTMEQPTGVAIDRWSLYRGYFSITEVAHGAAYSGLCRQVVLIQRYISITEVAHGAAYSGLCRQVVTIDRWSLYIGTLVSLRCTWPMERPTVVSIDRWSSYTSGLRVRQASL